MQEQVCGDDEVLRHPLGVPAQPGNHAGVAGKPVAERQRRAVDDAKVMEELRPGGKNDLARPLQLRQEPRHPGPPVLVLVRRMEPFVEERFRELQEAPPQRQLAEEYPVRVGVVEEQPRPPQHFGADEPVDGLALVPAAGEAPQAP